MSKSIYDNKKRKGRPATGINPLIGARLESSILEKLDFWALKNGVTRAEAIRRLIEAGLRASSEE